MATVNSKTSPAELLGRFRGRVASAGLTYPERAAIDIVDDDGGHWHLTTWWADFHPADPGVCRGKQVIGAELTGTYGLTIGFSDGTTFTIHSPLDEEDDAIENWELFTPERTVLSFGPKGAWRLGSADEVG